MTLRQQKAFANIILHCSLTLSITKMHKGVAYWRGGFHEGNHRDE